MVVALRGVLFSRYPMSSSAIVVLCPVLFCCITTFCCCRQSLLNYSYRTNTHNLPPHEDGGTPNHSFVLSSRRFQKPHAATPLYPGTLVQRDGGIDVAA